MLLPLEIHTLLLLKCFFLLRAKRFCPALAFFQKRFFLALGYEKLPFCPPSKVYILLDFASSQQIYTLCTQIKFTCHYTRTIQFVIFMLFTQHFSPLCFSWFGSMLLCSSNLVYTNNSSSAGLPFFQKQFPSAYTAENQPNTLLPTHTHTGPSCTVNSQLQRQTIQFGAHFTNAGWENFSDQTVRGPKLRQTLSVYFTFFNGNLPDS